MFFDNMMRRTDGDIALQLQKENRELIVENVRLKGEFVR